METQRSELEALAKILLRMMGQETSNQITFDLK